MNKKHLKDGDLSFRVPPAFAPAEKLATHPKVEYTPLADLYKRSERTADSATEVDDPTKFDPGGVVGPAAAAVRSRNPATSSSGGDDFDDTGGDDAGSDDAGFDDADSADGSGGGGGGSVVLAADVPEQLLVRVFDFSGQPGKVYRYRVKVFVHDPNNVSPNFNQFASSNIDDTYGGGSTSRTVTPVADSMLDQTVLERLAEIREKNATAAEDGRVYYRATEWSDPSPPVQVPLSQVQFFAGGVTAPQASLRKEGFAKVLSVVWDQSLKIGERKVAVQVPGEVEAARGAVLNFVTSPIVMHPLTLQLKAMVDHPIQTDAVVVDFRGGENSRHQQRSAGFARRSLVGRCAWKPDRARRS